jgi:hypothetical protein
MMICPKTKDPKYANWACPHSKPHKYHKECGGTKHCPPCVPLPDSKQEKEDG